MNLQEMIDYTAAQYLDDRTDMVDGDADSLWGDDFLVRQFNEAQRLIARAAWCIKEEGVSPAGVITLATGISVYDLHKSVLRVITATFSDSTWPLWRTTDARLRAATRPADDMPYNIDTAVASTGRPVAIATDAGTRQVRFGPLVPSATENGLLINLKIARLPVTWLTVDDMEAEPEVPEDYHLALCEFAAGKALTLPNTDGQQKTEGRRLIDKFNDDLREARRDRQRAEMDPALWNFASDTAGL